MSDYLLVFLASALPVSELRGAIPLGLSLHLPLFPVFFISIIGNLVPVVLILWLLQPVVNFSNKYLTLSKNFFDWLFSKTRKRHNHKFEVWGSLALILLVAIPLPFTGAWTGSLAAFVFGVPFWRALGLITIGVIIAGLVVSFISLGIIAII